MIYCAITPPKDATCGDDRCGTLALVRVVPAAAPGPSGAGPAEGTRDSCDLHWPKFRDNAVLQGHRVIDATGDARQLQQEFPPWRVFGSDVGRWYASRTGITVYGSLAIQLRDQIQAADAVRRPRVPGGVA
jgi:hypothetical protein